MSGQELKVTLNEVPHTFTTFAELREWAESQRDIWRWLEQVRNPWSMDDRIKSYYPDLLNYIDEVEEGGSAIGNVDANHIEGFFRSGEFAPSPRLVSSTSPLGSSIFAVLNAKGPRAGLFAYAFATRHLTLNDAQIPEDLAGAMMVAMPGTIHPDDLANAYRLQHQDAIENVERLQTDVRRAISDLELTKKTYAEYMSLAAAVDYWDTKSRSHASREGPARTRVIAFFLCVVPAIAAMFYVVSRIVLEHDKPGISILAGAGLATIIGTLFWIGRLLTRLYLSEHHLRNDSDERVVMIKTYLALIKEAGLEPSDRQLVLLPIFRNTPDGIVKDDGPPEFTFAGLVSRAASGAK
ncbi:MAG: hypothetical protein J7521_20910 [Caulobacter sp.]|nr:hypothetical protein [Caulobacter sp.]